MSTNVLDKSRPPQEQLFFDGSGCLEWIRAKLSDRAEATFAVAFWGAGAIEALDLNSYGVAAAAQLHIICNLSMGGTNPEEIAKLLKIPGLKVSQSDRLHSKVYLFDDVAMVGSSNVSANGLSFEGPAAMGWHEANLVTADEGTLAELKKWVANLPIKPITLGDLQQVKAAWKARRNAIPAVQSRQSIIDLLQQGPDAFAGLDLYVTLTAGDFTSEAWAAVTAARQDHPLIDAWEDWESLPSVGTFISFEERRGKIVYENCYTRSPSFPDRPKRGRKHSLQWCFKAPVPLGLQSPREDKSNWARIMKAVAAREGWPTANGAICVRFKDLATIWSKNQPSAPT